VAGGILGAMTFGYLEPALRSFLLSGGPGKLTLDQLAHVPFWALAIAAAGALVAVLVALERLQPWREEAGPNVDGLAAPTSQALSSGASSLSSASA
jgi:hypothetical protein